MCFWFILENDLNNLIFNWCIDGYWLTLAKSLGWWLGNFDFTCVGLVFVPTFGPKLKKQTLWLVFVDLHWVVLELDIASMCEPGPVVE